MSKARYRERRQAWWATTWVSPMWIGPLCLLAMFASVLLGRDRLAFRDVGYFYTPLYEFVAQQCQAQRWGALGPAIWNPLDQTGMPLAGETTPAVFYPLRMLVYAPPWSGETALGVYIVLHLIIASLGAYAAARRFRCDRWSAAVAGTVYPLSGVVLFLATNPPFLVAAAWLPLLLTPLITRRDDRIVVPGIAMAMMILGGDPPTALHALIVAAGVRLAAVLLVVSPPSQRGGHAGGLPARCALLGQWIAIVLLASILAAPQIAASLAWSARSDRVLSRTAPEIFKTREQAYAFSVPPWRLVEILIPNLYGSPWPTNTRWDRNVFDGGSIRAETALWTPTLYCGIALPFCLAYRWWLRRSRKHRRPSNITHWRLRKRRKQGWQWLLVLLIGLAGSMGAYGPAYLIRSAALAANSLLLRFGASWSLPEAWTNLDGKLGGLYWLLHEFLPGYDSLRYPSKWLPFAALAIAVLSAILVRDWHRVAHLRRQSQGDSQPPRLPITRICVTCGVAVGVGCMLLSRLLLHSTPVANDPFWGPFLLSGATRQIWFSGLHLAVCLALFFWVCRQRFSNSMRRAGSGNRWDSRPFWLALIVVDLMVAHWSLAPRIDRTSESRLLHQAAVEISSPQRWMRLHRDGGFPQQWRETSQAERMLVVEAGLRHAWFGRWHLGHDQAVINGMVSIGSREMAEFWYYARELDRELDAPQSERWQGWCELLGGDGFLRSGGDGSTAELASSLSVLPHVTWEPFEKPKPAAGSFNHPRQHHSVVALSNNRSAAWRELLTAHSSAEPNMPAFVSQNIADAFSRASSLSGEGSQPTIFSRRVYQDGNWRATLVPENKQASPIEADVFSVDLLSQGVLVPPGQWQVEFHYAPWWHWPLLSIAMLGWTLVIATASAPTIRQSWLLARRLSAGHTNT